MIRKTHDFWFGMARDEARHVGALDLVSTVLELEGKLDQPSPISLDDSTIVRLRELHSHFEKSAKPGLAIEAALKIALELRLARKIRIRPGLFAKFLFRRRAHLSTKRVTCR